MLRAPINEFMCLVIKTENVSIKILMRASILYVLYCSLFDVYANT